MMPTLIHSDPLPLLAGILAASISIIFLNAQSRRILFNIVNTYKSRRQLGQIAIASKSLTGRRDDLEDVPRVSNIFIHPIKSLRAVPLSETKLDEHGLRADRRVMIVRPVPRGASSFIGDGAATHRFFTQRQSPSLATIEATEPLEVVSDQEKKTLIKLSSSLLPDQQHVFINVHPNAIQKLPIRYIAGLWSDTIEVADVGDEAAEFVAKIVCQDDESYKDVRVVVILSSSVRRVNELYVPDAARVGLLASLPQGGLTDGFPILVATQSSLDELNKRLKEKGKNQLPMSRFRPNIVINNTSKPFDEDNWKAIQIGTGSDSVILHISKGCPRCKQSCTDQITGERHDEPLETLLDFRALGASEDDVYFGQNAVMNGYWWASSGNGNQTCYPGVIRVGDPVFILTKGSPTWDSETVQAE